MSAYDPQAERPWTAEEDKHLRNAVLREKSRPVKWDLVASSLPRRSKKECRKRWHHIMMEAVRKGEWKPEEDERLNSAIQKYGNNWCSVAQVVMTRDDIECKKRWSELQTRTTEDTTPSNHSSPWFPLQEPENAFPEQVKGTHEYPEPRAGFYGSSDQMLPNNFLQDYMISPHEPHFSGMMSNNAQLPSSASATLCPSPVGVMDNMETYIDFEPEFSTPNTTEIYTPNAIHNQHFDTNDWSWFDNMVTAPGSTSSSSELADSPAEYGSSASSYTSRGSSVPRCQVSSDPEDASIYNVQSSFRTPSDEMKASESFGAKVVIVVKSNNAKTLSSLDSIMKTLRANGHSIVQESKQPEVDYKCTTLSLNDVLRRY